MIIKSIDLKNFRNYGDLSIDFDEKTTILFGDNAQGKTNILEAAFMSAITKSHKGSKDKEIIKFNEDEGHIKTILEKSGKNYQIDIHLRKNKKKGIAVNKVPIKKAIDLFGVLNVVLFSPEDLNIIKEGPSERRRFIDMELCQLDKIYLSDLTNYNKSLAQRNKILSEINYKPEFKDTLPVWDDKLIEYGKSVIKTRRKFIEEINVIVKDLHSKITGGIEDIEVIYEPNVDDILFCDELIKHKDKDLRYAQTSVGPHRDDISITINGIDVRKYGSQGQQRTCALSLKLSEIKLVTEKIGEKPVLLLDDVLSELDSKRQTFILDNIIDTQTIITCTGIDEFIKNRFDLNKVYKVVNGTVEQITEI